MTLIRCRCKGAWALNTDFHENDFSATMSDVDHAGGELDQAVGRLEEAIGLARAQLADQRQEGA